MRTASTIEHPAFVLSPSAAAIQPRDGSPSRRIIPFAAYICIYFF